MADSYSWKQGARPDPTASPTKSTADRVSPQSPAGGRVPTQPAPARPVSSRSTPTIPAAAKPGTPGANSSDNLAGRIVHDERGNAVWDWLKDTARIAIDSTSRLLRKLEVPDLKVEETQEQELRIESDRDAGGGYDPYGGSGSSPGRTSGGTFSGTGGRGSGGNTASRDSGIASSRGGPTHNSGGGYDPYGKGVTKPTRKR